MRMARTPNDGKEPKMPNATTLEANPLADPNAPAADPNAPAADPNAPAADGPQEGQPNPDNLIKFDIDDYGPLTVDLAKMQPEVRKKLMYTATRGYVLNRVSTAVAAAKKHNGKFETYDAAQRNNPLQNHVPKPSGERKTVDVADLVKRAVDAMYNGDMGKRAGGGGAKLPKDPLVAHVTRTVTTEVFNKMREDNDNIKYMHAAAVVGMDGIEYLKRKIAENVKAGADEAEQLAVLDAKYVMPAKIALGMVELPGKLKGASSIL